MVRKLSVNKAQGLYGLYARYLINFSSYSAMGIVMGSLTSLVLRRTPRGLIFYSLLGAGLMGGIATQQSIQEYKRTQEAYKKHNMNNKLFEECPTDIIPQKGKEDTLSQSLKELEELKRSLSPKS